MLRITEVDYNDASSATVAAVAVSIDVAVAAEDDYYGGIVVKICLVHKIKHWKLSNWWVGFDKIALNGSILHTKHPQSEREKRRREKVR